MTISQMTRQELAQILIAYPCPMGGVNTENVYTFYQEVRDSGLLGLCTLPENVAQAHNVVNAQIPIFSFVSWPSDHQEDLIGLILRRIEYADKTGAKMVFAEYKPFQSEARDCDDCFKEFLGFLMTIEAIRQGASIAMMLNPQELGNEELERACKNIAGHDHRESPNIKAIMVGLPNSTQPCASPAHIRIVSDALANHGFGFRSSDAVEIYASYAKTAVQVGRFLKAGAHRVITPMPNQVLGDHKILKAQALRK